MKVSWSRVIPVLAFLILLLAGWTGGPQNSADFAIVAEAAKLRSHDPLLTAAPALLTHLGDAYVLLPLSAAVAAILFAIGRRRSALLLFLTVAGERMLLDGVKILVGRPRPELDEHPVMTHSFSFPSGHAANTMTVFVAIALFALPERHRWWSVPTGIALAAMVAATRPWLGVHWPTDIIGGWMLAALSIWAALWAQERFRLTDRVPSRTEA
ncbi:phosphatase PAP2 family protein [Sphingomonas sp. HDW15A]|uniref:phosphatase PAP2 family protein n=1 Tax=Sphingomonas sp. HDW15A TaxID=2714942 RepID=UPI00140C52EB|nr:phosphatase PAP2 family protein [Sphingomonas sp. HDW15A]QIK96223.1 phosphatase PAP2 family protein [Sphingomonas sp. HDW15A]